MMLRADWLLADDFAPSSRPTVSEPAECSVSAPPGDPHYLPLLLTHAYTNTHVLMSARCVCAHHRLLLLQPADFTWNEQNGGTRTTKQCVHIALCDIAGYYFHALLGGNGGGVSLRAITMDCLFLLIWTLPIPLVGCTSPKLLSTLLSWNIIKACGTFIKHVYTLKSNTGIILVWDQNKQTFVSFQHDLYQQHAL